MYSPTKIEISTNDQHTFKNILSKLTTSSEANKVHFIIILCVLCFFTLLFCIKNMTKEKVVRGKNKSKNQDEVKNGNSTTYRSNMYSECLCLDERQSFSPNRFTSFDPLTKTTSLP